LSFCHLLLTPGVEEDMGQNAATVHLAEGDMAGIMGLREEICPKRTTSLEGICAFAHDQIPYPTA